MNTKGEEGEISSSLKLKVMQYRTFQNKIVDTETMEHQHLSNCVWYSVLFRMGRNYTIVFIEALSRRFENKILPYRPHPLHAEEILHLISLGMVYFNDDGFALIMYGKKVIGEILDSSHSLYK